MPRIDSGALQSAVEEADCDYMSVLREPRDSGTGFALALPSRDTAEDVLAYLADFDEDLGAGLKSDADWRDADSGVLLAFDNWQIAHY